MAVVNPQPSTGNKTRDLVSLECWGNVGTGCKKSRVTRLKVAIDKGFLIRLSKLFQWINGIWKNE